MNCSKCFSNISQPLPVGGKWASKMEKLFIEKEKYFAFGLPCAKMLKC